MCPSLKVHTHTVSVFLLPSSISVRREAFRKKIHFVPSPFEARDVQISSLWLCDCLKLPLCSRLAVQAGCFFLSFFSFFFFCFTCGSLNTESPSVQENERHVLLGERSRDITREEETGVRYTCLIIRFCRTFKWQKIVQLIWGYFSWRLQILNNFFFSFFYANHNQQVKGWRRKANN